MNIHADKTQENKSRSVVNGVSQKQRHGEAAFQVVDNRPEAVAQRKIQALANNSPQVRQQKAIQQSVYTPVAPQAAQNSAASDKGVIQPKFVQVISDDPGQFEEDAPAISSYIGERRETWPESRFDDMPKGETLYINAHMNSSLIGSYSVEGFAQALVMKGFKGATEIRLIGCNNVENPDAQASTLRTVLSVKYKINVPVHSLKGVMKVIGKDPFKPQVITVPWGERHQVLKERHERDLAEAEKDPYESRIAKAKANVDSALPFQKGQKQKEVDRLMEEQQQNPDTEKAIRERKKKVTEDFEKQLDVVSFAVEKIEKWREDLIVSKKDGQVNYNAKAWVTGRIDPSLLNEQPKPGHDVQVTPQRFKGFEDAVVDALFKDSFNEERRKFFTRDFTPFLSSLKVQFTQGTLMESELTNAIEQVNGWIKANAGTKMESDGDKAYGLERDIYALCEQIEKEVGKDYTEPFMHRILKIDDMKVPERIALLSDLIQYFKAPDRRFHVEMQIYDIAELFVKTLGEAAIDKFMPGILGIDDMALGERLALYQALRSALAQANV